MLPRLLLAPASACLRYSFPVSFQLFPSPSARRKRRKKGSELSCGQDNILSEIHLLTRLTWAGEKTLSREFLPVVDTVRTGSCSLLCGLLADLQNPALSTHPPSLSSPPTRPLIPLPLRPLQFTMAEVKAAPQNPMRELRIEKLVISASRSYWERSRRERGRWRAVESKTGGQGLTRSSGRHLRWRVG